MAVKRHADTKGTILVTGTVAFDHLFSYDSEFLEHLRTAAQASVLSVSFQPDRYVKRNGGTGANIAWNVALLGGNPLLVAKVGTDGKEYMHLLESRGIDVSGIEVVSEELTATGVCCTDTREHQIWFFYRGADGVGHWPDLQEKRSDIQYAIIGARNPAKMLEGIKWCKANSIPTLFDPGQYILDFTAEALTEAINITTGIILNEFEWSMLEKQLGWSKEQVAEKVEYLIVTYGEEGHVIYHQGKKTSFPRCNCDTPVNPTGAGDAFRSGLVIGLTRGWTLDQASQLGAAIASFVVEQPGTLMESLDFDRLDKRVHAAYGTTLPPLPF